MSVLVKQAKPIKDTGILIQSCTILSTVYYSLSIPVDFVEYPLQDISVYLDVGVDDAGPMHDYVCEVGAEFLEIDKATFAHVHQSEAELVAFTG